MTTKKKINRAWLSVWLQGRRRKRQNHLLPAPVLVAQYPSLAVWEWTETDPFHWNAYSSLDGGVTYHFDDFVQGNARQYSPDGGGHLMFIVGVDAADNEITERSNAIRPDDAAPPPPPPAPTVRFEDGTLQITSSMSGVSIVRYYFSTDAVTWNAVFDASPGDSTNPCELNGNGFWRASVIGDDITYIGESSMSYGVEVDTCEG